MPFGWQNCDSRLHFKLRLEDLVAISFFLLNAIAFAISGGANHQEHPAWEIVGLQVIAVGILLALTLLQQTLSSRSYSVRSANDLTEFVLPYGMIIRDWFPFLTILAMYYSLWGDATHVLNPHDRDAALIAWDQRLFGFQASVALQRFTHPALTAWMKFAYNSHPFNLPLVALVVYLSRSCSDFRKMMSGLMVICFFGFLGYLFVPAVGPLYTLKGQYYIDLGRMQFMDFLRIRRDVFPSLHAGISFLVWIYAYRNARWLFWTLSPVILSLWLSTVYLRQHYLIDVIAGLVLAPLCVLLADWLFVRFQEVQFSFGSPVARGAKWPFSRTPAVCGSMQRREMTASPKLDTLEER